MVVPADIDFRLFRLGGGGMTLRPRLNDQQVGPFPVGAEPERADRQTVGRGVGRDERGGRRVAEQRTADPVVFVDVAGIRLAGDQKEVPRQSRFEKSFGDPQSVDVAAAPQIEVERAARFRKPELFLNDARRRGEEVVGRLCTQDEKIDLFRPADPALKEGFAGRNRHIDGRPPLFDDRTADDTELFFHLFGGPSGEPADQLVVCQPAARNMTADGANTGMIHSQFRLFLTGPARGRRGSKVSWFSHLPRTPL